jgi:fructoselysine-6-P-deglycase FrlB-like protein
MKSRTVEELLLELDLTEEEKEKHLDLIQDCLERQRRLIAFRKKSEEGVRAVEAHFNNIFRNLLILHQSVQRVNNHLAEVLLKNLPESKMPKA